MAREDYNYDYLDVPEQIPDLAESKRRKATAYQNLGQADGGTIHQTTKRRPSG